MKRLRVKTGVVKPRPIVFIGGAWSLPKPLVGAPLVEPPRCTSNPTCVERGLKPCHYCRTQREGERYWDR